MKNRISCDGKDGLIEDTKQEYKKQEGKTCERE